MSQCFQTPTIRIAKIRDNLKKEQISKRQATVIPESNMTDVLQNTQIVNDTDANTLRPEDAPNDQTPNVLPNAPNFRIPPNPLLPPEYREVLDYNDLQYVNGFFRTQIGRFVKVDCLVGSSQIVVQQGFLIAVGINYILLQEVTTGNILSIDFWSIKFMYIYYNEDEIKKITPLT